MRRRSLAVLAATIVTALSALSGVAHAAKPVGPEGGASPQIIGGTQAREPYPFVASLQYKDDPSRPSPIRCGATLIAPKWLVTAAHCVIREGAPIEPSKFLVKMGSNNHQSGTEYQIEKVVAHPWFGAGQESAGDIGLIKLTTAAPTRPIQNILHPAGETKLRMVGWGRTVADDPASTSLWLQRLDAPLLFFRDCQYGDEFDITPGDVCMSTEGGTAGPCNGDSGSPLLWQVNGVWRIVGVDSRGPGDACLSGNEVYTTTDYYWDWVTQQIQEDHTTH